MNTDQLKSTGRCGTQVRILNFVLVSYPDREIYQKDIEEELNIRSASVIQYHDHVRILNCPAFSPVHGKTPSILLPQRLP